MHSSRVFLLVLVLGASVVVRTEGSADAVKDMSAAFLKVMDECKQELGLTEQLLTELYHFWREDAPLSRNVGCVIVCMSKKLDILDSSGKLHHGNAKEFAVQHGAAEETATKLVNLVHECEKQFEDQQDECLRAADIARCFRKGVHDLNWAPDMDVIVSEVLTEV